MATTRAAIKARAKAIFEEGITGVIDDTAAGVSGGWNDIINAAMDIVSVDAMCIKGKITLATLKDAVASVTVAGTADTTCTPTVVFSNGTPVTTSVATIASGAVLTFGAITGGTAGWTTGDLANIVQPTSGTGGVCSVTAVGGEVTAASVTVGGSGYTVAACTLTPYGSGAKATASISSSGDISSVRVTSGGKGYTSLPTVAVTGASNRTTVAVLGIREAYNVVDGTDDTMLFIEEVTYNGQTIDPLAEDDLTSFHPRWRDQAGGTPRNYYVEGITPSARIVLYPKPSAVGDTIEVFGRVRPAPLPLATTSDNRLLEISTPFDWLVVWKAVQLACGQSMSDPLAAITKMQFAERQYLMNLDKFKGLSAWPDGRSLVKASAPGAAGWPPAWGRTEFM